MLLTNKNAIIYGGAGSLGSAVAMQMELAGARVFLTGRTEASYFTSVNTSGSKTDRLKYN